MSTSPLAARTLAFLFHTRNGKLVAIFIAFVVVQVLFGGLYFWLYRRRAANFSFNADILRAQTSTTQENTTLKLTRLEGAITALAELTKELHCGTMPTVVPHLRATVHLASGRKCVMHYHAGGPGHGPPPSSTFELLDADGVTLFSGDPTKPGLRGWLDSAMFRTSTAEWQDFLPTFSAKVQRAYTGARRRLDSLSTASPDIWSYWDFLYFSTIVQTTVGFGDILPNSTAVRLVVTGQIVTGYALLVVVLNVVLSG